LDNNFSAELLEVVQKSRDTALFLGYNYISSLHVLLSECGLFPDGLMRKLCFEDEATYNKFLASCKLDDSDIFSEESLPITIELETALQEAIKLAQTDNTIFTYPIQLYIQIFSDAGSIASSCYDNPGIIAEELKKYYREVEYPAMERMSIS
jgi:hypothetical protein